MHIKVKTMFLTGILAMFCLIPTAQASTWDSIKAAGSDLWDAAKSKGSEVVDTVKEKGPGWVDTAKDAASGAIDTIKEQAPGAVDAAKEKGSELIDRAGNAIQGAQEKFSDWNRGQQEEFWQRTDDLLNGGSPSQTTPAAPSASPSPTPAPSVPAEPTPTPYGVQIGDEIMRGAPPANSNRRPEGQAPSVHDAPAAPSAVPDATAAAGDEFVTYNGKLYQRVSEGGDLFVNDQMYKLVPLEDSHSLAPWQTALIIIGAIALVVCGATIAILLNLRSRPHGRR